MFRRAFFLCLLVLFSLPAASRAESSAFGAESFRLENGLEVVVIPNHRAPVVTHSIWYKAGGADEPHGKSGIAHFLEHLMFRGTKDVPPGEYSRIVRRLGGEDNAFTSADVTAYYQSVAREHLAEMMRMEADRMQNLSLPPEDVDSERSVVIEERRQRTENDPRGRFFEQIRYALYVNHPYGKPVIGWMHEMEAMSREDAREFYETWYAPNNAIVVISGDVTREAAETLAAEIYAPLEARELPERSRPPIPDFPGETLITRRDAEIHQPVWVRVMRAPSHTQDKADSLALQVAVNLLDGGSSTRLYRTLVAGKNVAVSIGMGYAPDRLGVSSIWLSATPAPGVSLEALGGHIEQELRRLADEGPDDGERERAIARMQDQAIFERDSLKGPAMIVGNALATGAALDDVENWAGNLETVTDADIVRVVRTYMLADSGRVTGYLLPEDGGRDSTPEQGEADE